MGQIDTTCTPLHEPLTVRSLDLAAGNHESPRQPRCPLAHLDSGAKSPLPVLWKTLAGDSSNVVLTRKLPQKASTLTMSAFRSPKASCSVSSACFACASSRFRMPDTPACAVVNALADDCEPSRRPEKEGSDPGWARLGRAEVGGATVQALASKIS